jgi:hypothetical protein
MTDISKDFQIMTIGDYGRGELAFKEVRDSIWAACKKHNINIEDYDEYAVPAFSTVSTAFALAQLSLTTKLPETKKFFVNTAPRGDDRKARVNNEGEGFVYGKLFNGAEFCAVNSGYSLSFVKEAATEIRAINVSKEGSQFRSRDNFPPAFAQVISGDHSILGASVIDTIPDLPKDIIVHIDGYGDSDGYGNLKIFMDNDELDELKGKDVLIEMIGNVEYAKDRDDALRLHTARVTDRIFDVASGEMAFAKNGSSGWNLPNGKRQSFAEIVVRSGDAYDTFRRPKIGTKLRWTPVG